MVQIRKLQYNGTKHGFLLSPQSINNHLQYLQNYSTSILFSTKKTKDFQFNLMLISFPFAIMYIIYRKFWPIENQWPHILWMRKSTSICDAIVLYDVYKISERFLHHTQTHRIYFLYFS